MAERDLDSFFAKKDKSKKKAKSAITVDDLAPDKKQKKKKKKSKEKEKESDASSSAVISKEEDAEWNDFESEEKDYSGLKIQNLQICAKDDEEENEEREPNSDSDEDGEKESGEKGPWNKANAEPAAAVEMIHEVPVPVAKKEEAAAQSSVVKSGKYVPPNLRKQMENPEPVKRVPKSKKVAPNIHNQEEFPTLGANPVPQEIDMDPRQFERVRQGGRSEDAHQKHSAPRLELGNKYGALSNTGD